MCVSECITVWQIIHWEGPWTILVSLPFHVFFYSLSFCFGERYCMGAEKAMATHSSTLAWKIPWMEEPGRLQFMGSLRVRHDWATSLSLFTFLHWRRKWQPTPVFLPGESQGRGSLAGCRLWGRTESDRTEATLQQQQQQHCMGDLIISTLCWLKLLSFFLIDSYVKTMKLKMWFNCFSWSSETV